MRCMSSKDTGGKSDQGDQDQREESEAERLDRNYGELLQEMRVLQAGMQILFAFLLTIAFQQRFASVTDFQRNVYLGSLVTASLATACIIGPVPFHRVVFRRGMKDNLIKAATRYVSAGLTFLFLSMTGAVLLVLDFLLGRTVAISTTVAVAAVYVVLWLVVPFLSRAEESDTEQDEPGN